MAPPAGVTVFPIITSTGPGYRRNHKCEFYRDTEKVFVQEERKTLNGIELLCLKGWSQDVCYWSLAAKIDVYARSFGATFYGQY